MDKGDVQFIKNHWRMSNLVLWIKKGRSEKKIKYDKICSLRPHALYKVEEWEDR